MLTIGEFSSICRVSTKTLRYYAEIGLILPEEINPENGYRYYSIKQLETMLFINRLKAYHFSLEEIKEILESEEVMDDKLYAALNKKKKEISMQVMMYRNTLEQIDADMSALRKGKSIMSYMEDIGIELVEVPKMYLLSIRKMIQEQDFPDWCGYCFGKLFKKMNEKRLTASAPPMVLFHSDEYSPFGLDTEFAVPIKEYATGTRDFYPGLCLKTVVHRVCSIDDILVVFDKDDNRRLAQNLFLEKDVLEKISKIMDPFKRSTLDYKIQNISMLASDESVPPLERAMTSIKKFNRMSESEVVTPAKVCDEMVALLPEDGLRNIVSRQEKLLDIASKSGEYAVSLYKRLTSELGYSHDEIKDLIYSIPTSSVAYEFTRRFYEILGLNIENIATKFNAYDLLEIRDEEDKVSFTKIDDLLKQEKQFSEITLDDNIKEGDKKMQFGAVIGNPPYQISDGGAQASAKPIYHYFVLMGKELASNYSCYITPTRWFAGGKGLDEFRDLMLTDRTMRELHDFLTPEDVFPNTNNRGGVCYFVNDGKKTESTVRVVTHKNNGIFSDVRRNLMIDGVNIFIRDSVAINIIKKIFKDYYDDNFSSIVSSRKPFGLESKIIKTDIFTTNRKKLADPVVCIGKNKCKGYIEKNNIKAHKEWIDKWKVYVPRANNIGTELNDDNLNSFVGEPNSVCTEAYIVVGAGKIDDENSAYNLCKYLNSKFARFLHRQAKASQDASSKTYRFIPLENFTNKSDIDWSKSIDEIDEQLFDKYGLSNEEKEHIKTSIKDM